MERDIDQTTKEDVLKNVRDKDVKFIQLWFTRCFGYAKSFTVSFSALGIGMNEGMGAGDMSRSMN